MPVHYVYLLFKIIIILRSNHIKILLIFAMVNYLGSLNVFHSVAIDCPFLYS